MRRRELLKAAGAGVAALATPWIGRAEKASKLVFVPTSDLAVLDPVVPSNRPTRNHAYLVFDTLYGIDTNWMAQPQMVEGHQVEEDGLIWTLRLRDGLRFHDKEPVLAHDVVASIRRFATRIPFAAALMAATDELSATDDRTVRFRLKRPFPHLPEALAGPGGVVPAIMPERLAATSPFKPVAEITGSGPYRFLPDEHVIGARAAYERSTLYQLRQDGPVGFTAKDRALRSDRVARIGSVFGDGRAAQCRNRLVGGASQRPNPDPQSRSRYHCDFPICDGHGHPSLQPSSSAL